MFSGLKGTVITPINKFISWSNLKNIQKLQLVKSMYIWTLIVPILVKSFSGFRGEIELTMFGHKFNFIAQLPFSLITFYFCSLIFTLANLVFFLSCHSIVKDYKNYSEFINEGKNKSHIEEYANELKYRPPSLNKGHSDSLSKAFWETYSFANNQKPTMRSISTLLYGVGILLLIRILVENLNTVVAYAF